MGRELREVVYVDGVRTAFGKAGPGGAFWKTRADDMAVKVVRELLRRNPNVPAERIGDVILAATAQVGDQGLTLGRDVALLAGLPHTVPGFAVDRMCAGALTATTAGAGEIAMGAADLVIVGGVEHMGHHPMGAEVGVQPAIRQRAADRPERRRDGADGREPPRRLPPPDARSGRSLRAREPAARTRAWGEPDGVMASTVVPMSVFGDGRLEGRRARRVPPAGDDARGAVGAANAVSGGRPRHCRKLGGADRRRNRGPARGRIGRGRAGARAEHAARRRSRTPASSRT